MAVSNARAVPLKILDQTIGKAVIVTGSTDPRLYDATVGAYVCSLGPSTADATVVTSDNATITVDKG